VAETAAYRGESVDISAIREQLLIKIERQADLRRQKAEELPADQRNLESAAELDAVKSELEQLPTENFRLLRLARLWDSLAADPRAVEIEDEFFRGYGFHGDYTGGDHAGHFLEALTSELTHELGLEFEEAD